MDAQEVLASMKPVARSAGICVGRTQSVESSLRCNFNEGSGAKRRDHPDTILGIGTGALAAQGRVVPAIRNQAWRRCR